MMKLRTIAALALLALAAIPACGGGGGGGTSGSVNLFTTDRFSEDYDQVWLTIHRVELRDDAGAYVEVFDGLVGVLFDAARLTDPLGGRFSFLGRVGLPNGTYDKGRVTLGPSVVLVPTGGTAGVEKAIDDALPRDALGRPMGEFDLTPPLTVANDSGTEVIDFDLAGFSIDVDDEVVPSLGDGDEGGVDDPERHEVEDYEGVVSNLTGATFLLAMPSGASATVAYGPATPIYLESTSEPGVLANGRSVEVVGVFDGATGNLLAQEIKIEDAGAGEAEATGMQSAVDLIGNTLTLADLFDVEGFMPQGSTVGVTWDDATVFRRSGELVDESWLLTHPFAEAKGAFDEASNTITATRITLEDEDGHGPGEAEAKGTHTTVDTGANTLLLTAITEAFGFTPAGGVVNVVWSDATTVFRRSGEIVDESWLGSFTFSEVKGTYTEATNTLDASRITLEDGAGEEGEDGESEATGTHTDLDLAANSLTLTALTEVFGFTPGGPTVLVVWDAATVFRFKGDTVDESCLAANPRAEAKGTYDGPTNTITAERVTCKEAT